MNSMHIDTSLSMQIQVAEKIVPSYVMSHNLTLKVERWNMSTDEIILWILSTGL